MALPLSLSYGSSSGVSGDTQTDASTSFAHSSPFAVGSGARSDGTATATAGKPDLNTLALYAGGALALVLVVVVVIRVAK